MVYRSGFRPRVTPIQAPDGFEGSGIKHAGMLWDLSSLCSLGEHVPTGSQHDDGSATRRESIEGEGTVSRHDSAGAQGGYDLHRL
jgi:hypothetical protein